MWQRFTERARRVVFFSQEEAGRLGENYVSTEHLLLGLVRENDSVAARLLDGKGVSLGRIRSEIERQVTRGEGRLGQDMQLTPRAKRVIDLAYDEARKLENNYIGTEHLLLGLIREAEGLAGRVLAKLAVDLDDMRARVRSFHNENPAIQSVYPTTTPLPKYPKPVNEPHKGALSREQMNSIYHEIGHGLASPTLNAIQNPNSLWRGKSLIGMSDVSAEQFHEVLDAALVIKRLHISRNGTLKFSYPATLALLFEKPSLRTRTSFDAGMSQLGGSAIYLAPGDVGLGKRESVEDVAGSLSRWVDVIAARVFDHSTVEELDLHSTVPVINALSDREHPLQMFADMLTINEHFGKLDRNLKIAYVGDGNNVLNSLMIACATLGVHLSAACPEGYEPDPSFITKARSIADEATAATEIKIEVVSDPIQAVKDADVVYTDVWTSMGQESKADQRRALFAPYSVTSELMSKASPNAIALHCLPAHRGEEITAEVMDKHKIVILDQAENRLHTQKALLLLILGID